jgi:hypothetical protein
MSRFTDIYLEEVPQGSLVYPSCHAQQRGHGNYILDGGVSHTKNDSDIFPALVINPRTGILLTPTGLKNIGPYALVSVMK